MSAADNRTTKAAGLYPVDGAALLEELQRVAVWEHYDARSKSWSATGCANRRDGQRTAGSSALQQPTEAHRGGLLRPLPDGSRSPVLVAMVAVVAMVAIPQP